MIKDLLAGVVRTAIIRSVESCSLGKLTIVLPEILNSVIIERTKNTEFGDYSCNVSYLAKEARVAPVQIAEIISKNIDDTFNTKFSTSVVSGFINFTIKPDWLNSTLSEILCKKENYGRSDSGKNLKVLLEYVSANPTGPLHIGHGRWAALGSCIEQILKFAGYDVKTEFYINDAGSQINNLGHSLALRILQENDKDIYFPLDKEIDTRAASLYPGAYLINLAKRYISQYPEKAINLKNKCKIDNNLYIPENNIIDELTEYAKPILLRQQKDLLARFKTTFDIWYSETSLHASGKVDSILNYLEKNNAVYEKDNAIWFASSRFLDNQDRVIKKSDGTLTYLTADIAYHKDKYDRGFEHLINIWGADHHGYVARMKSAVEALGYKPDSLEVIIGQMVNLIIDGEQVRMGKRKKMLTLEDLIDEVGVDATRFWMISKSTDTTLDFDVELAKSTSDENPVYYVQYAHARCCSILRTAVKERINTETKVLLEPLYKKETLQKIITERINNPELLSCLFMTDDKKQNSSTKALVIMLELFNDLILKASRDKSPNYIARYLLDLAACLHSFYSECRVLNLNDVNQIPEELQNARITLVDATRQILYNGLSLLLVNAPESM